MTPGTLVFRARLGLTPAGRRLLLRTLRMSSALLTGLAIGLALGLFNRQAGAQAPPMGGAGNIGTEWLLVCGIALLACGALVLGSFAATALRRAPGARAAGVPAQHETVVPQAPLPATPPSRADGTALHAQSGWTTLWPANAATKPPAAPGAVDETHRLQAHGRSGHEPDERLGFLRLAKSMTATSRALSREADDLSDCSLDLSALANSTLRSALALDDSARAAHLDVSAALITVARELATERAGRQEIENCVIHARVTRQLLRQLLGLAARIERTGSAAGSPDRPGMAWQDDNLDLAQLGADCLQAIDRMTGLAADAGARFQAAESAARERMEMLESLAGHLQDLSTSSAFLVRMNQSQVDYGNNIAHLAGRLAMGATCLTDDLQLAFRAD